MPDLLPPSDIRETLRKRFERRQLEAQGVTAPPTVPDPDPPQADADWDRVAPAPVSKLDDVFSREFTARYQDNTGLLSAAERLAQSTLAPEGQPGRGLDWDSGWRDLRAELKERGIVLALDGSDIFRFEKNALQRARAAWGPLWNKLRNEEDTAKLLSTAYIQEAVSNARFDLRMDTPRTEAFVQKKVWPTLRAPQVLGEPAPKQFRALVREAEHFVTAMEKGDWDPSARRWEESNIKQLYQAVTGQIVRDEQYRPLNQRHEIVDPLKGWLKGVAWWRDIARQSVMYNLMGVKVRPEHFDNQGQLDLRLLPLYDETRRKCLYQLGQGVAFRDPQGAATVMALDDIKQRLSQDTAGFLKEVTGQDAPPDVVHELDRYSNPDQKFLYLIDSFRAPGGPPAQYGTSVYEAKRQSDFTPIEQVVDSFFSAAKQVLYRMSPVRGFTGSPLNNYARDAGLPALYHNHFVRKELDFLVQHKDRQQKVREQEPTIETDAEFEAAARDEIIKQRNKAWTSLSMDARTWVNEHSKTLRFAYFVPRLLSSMWHATGVPGLQAGLLNRASDYIVDRFIHPLPTEQATAGTPIDPAYVFDVPKKHMAEWFREQVWPKGPDVFWEAMRARMDAGQANMWDDAAILGVSLWEFGGDLTELPLRDPAGMFALGGGFRLHHKLGNHLLKVAKEIDLPAPVRAGIAFAWNPLNPKQPLNVLFGRNAAHIQNFEVGAREVKKAMNRANPEVARAERAKLKAARDFVKNRPGMIPEEALNRFEAVHASIWSRVERGEHISLSNAEKYLDAAAELTKPDLVREFAIPEAIKVPSPVRDAHVAREAVRAELKRLSQWENLPPDVAGALEPTFLKAVAEAHNAAWQNPAEAKTIRARAARTLERAVNALPIPEAKRLEWAGKLRSRYDKAVNLMTNAPQVAAQWDSANLAYRENKVQLAELEQAFNIVEKTYRLRWLKDAAAQERLIRRAMEIAERKDPALTKEAEKVQAEIEALDKRRATRNAFAQTARTAIGEIKVRRAQKLVGSTRAQGPEYGYNPRYISQGIRQAFAEPMHDLLMLYGDQAREFGVPEKMVEAWYKTLLGDDKNLRTLKAAEAVGANYNTLRKAFGREEWFEVARLLNEKTTNTDLLSERAALHLEKLAAERRGILEPLEARLRASLSTAEVWRVRPIGDIHKDMISQARRLAQTWERSLAANDLDFNVWQTFKIAQFPEAQRLVQSTWAEATASKIENHQYIVQKLKEKYREQLEPADQEHLDRAWSDPNYLEARPEVKAHIEGLLLEEQGVRKQILEYAQRVGRLPSKDLNRYLNTIWHDRYSMREEYADMIAPQPSPTAQTIKPSKTAQYHRFRPQRSPSYVRDWYIDPQTGGKKELRYSVEESGGPDAAYQAALAQRRKLIRTNEVPKKNWIGGDADRRPLRALTDADMLGMGVLDNKGQWRFDKIQDIIADNARMRLFNNMAQVPGFVLPNLNTIPHGRQGEWVKLRGRQWGALGGQYIHKTAIQWMNAFDRYNVALAGMRDAFIADLAQTPGQNMLGWWKTMRLRNAPGPVRFASGLLRSIYHRLIIQSHETWVTNYFGNFTSAMFSGVNPLSTEHIKDSLLFTKLNNELRTGVRTPELVERMKVKYGKDVVEDFLYLHDQGRLAPTVGSPVVPAEAQGSSLWSALKRIEKTSTAARQQHARRLTDVRRAVKRLESAVDAEYDARMSGEKGQWSDKELAKAETKLSELSGVEKQLAKRWVMQESRHPILAAAERWGTGLTKEGFRLVTNTDSSVLAAWLSDKYSQIDARQKFAGFRAMRRKHSMSQEAALSDLDAYYQNYGRVPPWVRTLKMIPFVGAMVPSFAYEAGRILKNVTTRNPGQAFAVMSAPFVWNMAALSSRGLTLNDVSTVDNHDSATQSLFKLFTHAAIPTRDGFSWLYTGKYLFNNIFTYGGGPLQLRINTQVANALEKHAGPFVAAPVVALMNYVSQFIGTRPETDIGIQLATGVDMYNREITFGRGVDMGPVETMWETVGKLFTPRTLSKLYDDLKTARPPSPITGHQREWYEQVLRMAAGINLTSRPDSEGVGALALRYAGANILPGVLRDMRAPTKTAIQEKAHQARIALDEQDMPTYNQLKDEIAELVKQSKERSVYLGGGEWFPLEAKPQQVAEEVIRHIGRNKYDTIARIPVDLAPRFAFNLWTSKYRLSDKAAMDWTWQQLQDPDILKHVNDSDGLERAITACAKYASNLQHSPELRAQFEKCLFNADKGQPGGLVWRYMKVQQMEAERGTIQAKLRKLLEANLGNQTERLLQLLDAFSP